MKNDLFAKIIIISGLIPIVLLTFTIIFYSENKLFEAIVSNGLIRFPPFNKLCLSAFSKISIS